MSNPLLPPTFLFRFSQPCHYQKQIWGKSGVELDEAYRLCRFASLEGRREFADVRAAWSEAGISLTVRASGKIQAPWCRDSRLEDSDGLMVWIDTRDTHNIHRASRFCHRFVFLPSGSGSALADPVADQLIINRARENAKPITLGTLQVRSEKRGDGYFLQAHIPAKALTGFDPLEHQRLGFTYAVTDRELGWQTLSIGTEFPIEEDPSLWSTLELVK